MVAGDRVSAFDRSFHRDSGQGRLLSCRCGGSPVVRHHRQPCDIGHTSSGCSGRLGGRTLVCRRLDGAGECVTRGYLTGSGWPVHRHGRGVRVRLPEGLVDGSARSAVFTPATKAEVGSMTNVSLETVADGTVQRWQAPAGGDAGAGERGREIAEERGILPPTQIRVRVGLRRFAGPCGRSAHSDSSRFWPKENGAGRRSRRRQAVGGTGCHLRDRGGIVPQRRLASTAGHCGGTHPRPIHRSI